MPRIVHSRSPRAVMAAIVAVAAIGTAGAATSAHATVGPGCEAGAPCADGDGDGFVACACAPPGVVCDCDDSDPRSFPGAPETCDSPKDHSCSGVAGDSCGAEAGCLGSVCVPECIPLDDFGCAPYAHCESQPNGQRLCAGPDCSIYGCPSGSTCDDAKTCIANCNAGVRCPFGQRCRGFGCVDPCDGVVCAAGAACENGVCVASCDCLPGGAGCPSGQACDRSKPEARCVEQSCVSVTCAVGSHCVGGACVDDCAGVVCPPLRVCKQIAKDGGVTRGTCVDLCSPNPCALGFLCEWRTGACVPAPIREAGLDPVRPLSEDATEQLSVGGGGISCATGGLARASATVAISAALSFALLLARRAHRRRRGPKRGR
jgi:hypothetical protein